MQQPAFPHTRHAQDKMTYGLVVTLAAGFIVGFLLWGRFMVYEAWQLKKLRPWKEGLRTDEWVALIFGAGFLPFGCAGLFWCLFAMISHLGTYY